MAQLQSLGKTAREYLAEHGRRSVSAAVRRWVSHPESVRHCGEARGGMVPVTAGARGPRLSGLKQCKNRFVDPYCSGWYRQELAERIESTVVQFVQSHDVMVLVNTFSHDRSMSLKEAMTIHASAWDKSKRGRRSVLWCDVKWLKVWDIIVGGKNGPHPHTNSILIAPRGTLSTEWLGKVSLNWASAICSELVKSGHISGTRSVVSAAVAARKSDMLTPVEPRRGVGTRSVVGVPVDEGNAAVMSAYAARHVEGAAVELVDDRSRSPRAHLGGFSLLDLACMAHAGQDAAGRLLAASAADLWHRRSWSSSKSWPALDLDDDDDAEAVLVDDLVLGLLPAARYRAVRQQLDSALDAAAGQTLDESIHTWHDLNARLDLGIHWLDAPMTVSEFYGDA